MKKKEVYRKDSNLMLLKLNPNTFNKNNKQTVAPITTCIKSVNSQLKLKPKLNLIKLKNCKSVALLSNAVKFWEFKTQKPCNLCLNLSYNWSRTGQMIKRKDLTLITKKISWMPWLQVNSYQIKCLEAAKFEKKKLTSTTPSPNSSSCSKRASNKLWELVPQIMDLDRSKRQAHGKQCKLIKIREIKVVNWVVPISWKLRSLSGHPIAYYCWGSNLELSIIFLRKVKG